MDEPGVRRFTDHRGEEVRLTDERPRHILRRHPEMGLHLRRIAETLAEPDAVTMPDAGSDVRLYFRLYSGLRGRRRYICVVTKRTDDYSFILTSYPDRQIKGVPA